MATSPIRITHPRNYPAWELSEPTEITVKGVRIRAWVSKSGKTGAGVTIAVTNCGGAEVQFAATKVVFLIEGVPRPILARSSAPTQVARGQINRFYLSLSFDNESLWNQGQRAAKLQLALKIGDQTVPWTLSANHVLRSFHKEVRSSFLPKKEERLCGGDNRSEQPLCPGISSGVLKLRGGQ